MALSSVIKVFVECTSTRTLSTLVGHIRVECGQPLPTAARVSSYSCSRTHLDLKTKATQTCVLQNFTMFRVAVHRIGMYNFSVNSKFF